MPAHGALACLRTSYLPALASASQGHHRGSFSSIGCPILASSGSGPTGEVGQEKGPGDYPSPDVWWSWRELPLLSVKWLFLNNFSRSYAPENPPNDTSNDTSARKARAPRPRFRELNRRPHSRLRHGPLGCCCQLRPTLVNRLWDDDLLRLDGQGAHVVTDFLGVGCRSENLVLVVLEHLQPAR